MTERSEGVRGAATSRGGATDTAMLIWKVIAANPGIDRAGIWERVEHSIPEGYALRMYQRHAETLGRVLRRDALALNITRARGHVLSRVLSDMRRGGAISWDDDGNGRHYTVARELRYKGNVSAVDETGTKAAQHMALVDAWRTIAGLVARCNPERPKANPKVSIKEAEALRVAFDAWRGRETADS